ncbi:MAG: hypothetical protein LC687_02715, partial [Actinobacteria bacterium]|nr:hypothetical protein [Actinomycetota bacterium]
LGSSTNRWRDLYLGPQSLNIGTDANNATISYNTTGSRLQLSTDTQVQGSVLIDSQLGIGTDNPQAELDVQGHSRLQGTDPAEATLTIQGTAGQDAALLDAVTAGGSEVFRVGYQSSPDVESWDIINNSNISSLSVSFGLAFTSDDQVLVSVGGDRGVGLIAFIDSSDSSPANWTEITNSNVSLPGTGFAATFTNDDSALVIAQSAGVTFVDSSDPNPANWTEVTNTNVSLPGAGYAASFTNDDNVLILSHDGGSFVTFVDSSDPNPANWTEITNSNVSLPATSSDAAFTSNNGVLVLTHSDGDNVTFVDSSDPNPANWTEVTNSNVSLPGGVINATFTSNDGVLVLTHGNGDHITFVDSSDPNPANWTEITNSNVSLPGTGYATSFNSNESVLALAHTGGDHITFVDSSDPNPANWTEITNTNVSLPGASNDVTFAQDGEVLVLGHFDGDGVTFVDSSFVNTEPRIGIGNDTPQYALDVVTVSPVSARFSGRVIGVDAVNNDEFVTLGQANSLFGGSGSGGGGGDYLQGGNAFGSTAVLGTTDNNTLELITNDTARLTI